eukprot:12201017-Ditylum_brightwellii.AAC.1
MDPVLPSLRGAIVNYTGYGIPRGASTKIRGLLLGVPGAGGGSSSSGSVGNGDSSDGGSEGPDGPGGPCGSVPPGGAPSILSGGPPNSGVDVP